MYLTADKTDKIQTLIKSIYTEDLTTTFLTEKTSLICDIMDSHYFATIVFPNQYASQSLYLSNNPEEFNKRYLPLQDKDFLLNTLVEYNQPVVLQDLVRQDIPGKHEFLGEFDNIRPVSDCCYIPMKLNERLNGFVAVARAGEKNRVFDQNDLETFKFISEFINEGFIRSLKLPDIDGDTAYLDAEGRILSAGESLKSRFKELFSERFWDDPSKGWNSYAQQFRTAFSDFIKPLNSPGSGTLTYNLETCVLNLEFRKLNHPSFRYFFSDEPQYEITMKQNLIKVAGQLNVAAWDSLYRFTAREKQVIDCIYKGLSNKSIADELKISLSTVKRHIWNIYNKTGVDNRTGLIFLLS